MKSDKTVVRKKAEQWTTGWTTTEAGYSMNLVFSLLNLYNGGILLDGAGQRCFFLTSLLCLDGRE